MKTLINLLAAAFLLAGSALADVHYVDVNSTNAAPPYTNWATAAKNIQDAVDAAVAGDEIVVTNGTYHPVRVGMSLKLRSVNGPQFTTIDGYVGGWAFRCAYLAGGANLTGFTLTNGRDRYNSTPFGGGGVFCESVTAVVSNCMITGNHASGFSLNAGFGGGAYDGTLNNCTLSNNQASVSDGYTGGLLLAHGGGAYGSTLNNCTLTGNRVSVLLTGTGSFQSTAYGGGAHGCTLNNCTLTGNQAAIVLAGQGGLARGGGAYGSTLNNCIGYSNTVVGSYGVSYEEDIDFQSIVSHCWFSDPLFVDYAGGNLRLQSNSPCINAGNNAYVTNATDLDGNPRIAGGTVDIGAYEIQSPVSQISYAWLQQFGLPVNSSTDTADPDGDAVDNYHEWLAGTNPTNALSTPAQLTITTSGVAPGGIILTWSTNAVGFTLQSTTNLLSPAAWVSNSPAPVVINGQNAVTNPISGVQKFYRLSH